MMVVSICRNHAELSQAIDSDSLRYVRLQVLPSTLPLARKVHGVDVHEHVERHLRSMRGFAISGIFCLRDRLTRDMAVLP